MLIAAFDKKASEKYRLFQANSILASISIVISDTESEETTNTETVVVDVTLLPPLVAVYHPLNV